MNRVAGKIAIVTGCAGILGAAQARMLAAEGATMILADIADARGEAVAAEIRAAGGAAAYRHLDVTDEADWTALIDAVMADRGRLDILVNNAGGNLRRATIEERAADQWDALMALNAKSVFLGTKHALPHMRAAGRGSIVNISSLAALGLSTMMEAVYVASKAAVHMFTKATAAQYGAYGIRCNSVHPGPIDSEMLRGYYASPELKAERLSHVPLGRFGQADEVAAAVLYLASDESGYTTGAQIVVDGGSLVR